MEERKLDEIAQILAYDCNTCPAPYIQPGICGCPANISCKECWLDYLNQTSVTAYDGR